MAIGLYFSRRAMKSVDEYFVSGRTLPWWLAGMSMIASAFSIDTPMGITGLVAKDGIPGVWYAWSFVIGGAGTMGAFLFAALLRRSEIITTAELIELRYDGKPAAFLRGFKGLYFGILANAITLGWIIKSVWIVSGAVAPEMNADLVLAALLGFTLLYTTLSGLWGIAATDFFQFLVGSAGSFLLAYFAWEHVGGVGALVEKFTALHGAEEASARLSFFPALASGFFPTFLVFITLKWWGNPPPAITQRQIACKNEKHASLSTMFFAVVAFGINYWPMIFTALVSLTVYPGLKEPENGFAMLIVELLPKGVLGLMLASLMAAFMSTIDTHINFGASYMVNDLYRRFLRKNASMRHYVRASQVSTVIMLLLAVGVAYNLDSVNGAWLYLSTLTAGYGIVIVARWFWWRVNAWGEIAALASSGIASTLLAPRFAKMMGYTAPFTSGRPDDFAWRFLTIVALCTICWVTVCLLTKPTDLAHLRRFCEKVRPYPAFWGPVYRNNPDLGWNPYFKRACLNWGLGTAAVFLCCFGVGHLMFARWELGGGMVLASVMTAGLVFRLWKDVGGEKAQSVRGA